MAHRWNERDDVERGYSPRERHERGMADRAGDEVRSWFGDDEAARRRRMDEARDERDERYGRGRDYERDRNRDWTGRGPTSSERGWEPRDAVSDVTDRDRDGRRGLDEWRDEDRWRDRPYGTASRYGVASPPPRRWSGNRTWETDRDRAFGGTSRYANADDGRTRTYVPTGYTGDADQPDWRSSSYAGRGPRGYQRGDERIREDVCDRLTDDPRIDASDIEVAVQGGEVTLSGSVRSREEKRVAEDAIERITGVRDVTNHLKVKPVDEVLGTARSGASVLGLRDTPPAPPPAQKDR
jgi:osmotically-inducible protein OsmY